MKKILFSIAALFCAVLASAQTSGTTQAVSASKDVIVTDTLSVITTDMNTTAAPVDKNATTPDQSAPAVVPATGGTAAPAEKKPKR